MSEAKCEALFSLLEKAEAEHIFDQSFVVEVCDGSAWDMKLRHSDNKITLIEGTVEYPTLVKKSKNTYAKLLTRHSFLMSL